MVQDHRHFVPAAGRDWLLPLYDPVQRLLLREKSIKRQLVEQARVGPGARVLDIGCGTGSLTLELKRRHPDAEVVGVDPDPRALARAERKAASAGLALQLQQGFADELPFPDGCFDRVFSSLMLHHLSRAEKRATLRAVRRVLAPGGTFHLLDFGPPRGPLARLLSRLVHREEALADNLAGRLPELMAEAGLEHPEQLGCRNTAVGTLAYYRAVAPGRRRGPDGSLR